MGGRVCTDVSDGFGSMQRRLRWVREHDGTYQMAGGGCRDVSEVWEGELVWTYQIAGGRCRNVQISR